MPTNCFKLKTNIEVANHQQFISRRLPSRFRVIKMWSVVLEKDQFLWPRKPQISVKLFFFNLREHRRWRDWINQSHRLIHVVVGDFRAISLAKISARSRLSRRDWRDLGEISVILGENFSGEKISARSRRGNRDLGEISVILGVIFRALKITTRSRRDCGCLSYLGEIRGEIFRGRKTSARSGRDCCNKTTNTNVTRGLLTCNKRFSAH